MTAHARPGTLPFAGPHGILRGARRIAGRGGTVLTDHALISGTNLITTVIAARAMTLGEFSAFTLAYVTLLVLNALLFGLIGQSHNVIGPLQSRDDLPALTRTAGHLQLLAALVIAISIGTLALGLAATGHASPILPAMAIAGVCWQMQDFMRRAMFTTGDYRNALANDIVSCVPQMALFLVVAVAGRLDPVSAMLIVAVASFAGVVMGVRQLGPRIAGAFDGDFARQLLASGRWLAGAQLLYIAAGHGYLYLAGVLAGDVEVSALRIALTVIAPLNIGLFALDSTLPATLSRARRSGGESAFQHRLHAAVRWTAAPVAIYALAVAFVAAPVLGWVFGTRAASDAGPVLPVLAAYCAALSVTRVCANALRARDEGASIFVVHAIGLAVSLPVGIVLVPSVGAEGAAWAMLTGAATSAVLLGIRLVRSLPGPVVPAGQGA